MIKCNTHTTTQKNKIKNNLFEKKLFQLWTHFHFCKKVFLLTFVMRVTCNKWKKLPWTFAQSTEYLGFFYMRSCANPIQEENHFFPSKHWVESGGLRDWHFIWIDRNPPSWWMTANSWLREHLLWLVGDGVRELVMADLGERSNLLSNNNWQIRNFCLFQHHTNTRRRACYEVSLISRLCVGHWSDIEKLTSISKSGYCHQQNKIKLLDCLFNRPIQRNMIKSW